MQLKITWKFEDENGMDTIVSDEQIIADTMKVLACSGYIGKDILKDVKYVRSSRLKRILNVTATYRDNHIYNGDILELSL